ncbi:MAG TPA: hypothetical protein VFM65_05515 [Flavobacteriaceae bacterium]|nr:hypothetical protein [Flavobacteriaceae bacterium]
MQKLLSIFLSVLLLTSATNIAYGQHFCGGNLMKSMLTFSETTLSCGMEQMPTSCEKSASEQSVHEKSCCENELHQVQTDEHFSGSHFQFDFHKNFTFAFVSVFVLDEIGETAQKVEFFNYYPPPIDKDVQVLYQVFLI